MISNFQKHIKLKLNIYLALKHLFQGNYEKLKEIWSLLELSQLKPDIQVYAAAFECLINKKETCSTDALRDLAKQFFSDVRCINIYKVTYLIIFYFSFYRGFYIMI